MSFEAKNSRILMASQKIVVASLRPVVAAASGLLVGLIFVQLTTGESGWRVLQILMHSSFGSLYGFCMTLFYATPLILTGLSVSIAFQCGLFNIGAEGQLMMGALSAAVVGALFPHVPWPLAPVLGTCAAFLGGAIWGGIPGWLKAHRGSHEVINTIMLNFIAAAFCNWVTLHLLPNRETQSPETLPVAPQYLVHQFKAWSDAPLSVALFLALAVAVAVSIFLKHTRLGYEVKAAGQNEIAARFSGISPQKMQWFAMALAGGVAGLVGVGEVLGNAGRFRLGFSADFGFIGIAVALLGRAQPLGVVFSALLFGALHKGTADLDLETENVTRDLSLILQAAIIFSVSADALWDFKSFQKWRKRRAQLAQTSRQTPTTSTEEISP